MKYVLLALSALFFVQSSYAGLAATGSYTSSGPIHLLPVASFNKLSHKNQEKYLATVQGMIVDIENTQQARGIPFGANKDGVSLLQYLINEAHASVLCSVGGVFMDVTSANKCPTWGRNCTNLDKPNSTDNFKCGVAFGEACVARALVGDLSQRCFNAAQDDKHKYKTAAQQNYGKYKDHIEKLFNDNCTADTSSHGSDGCKQMQAQLNNFKNPATATAATTPATAPAAPVTKPADTPLEEVKVTAKRKDTPVDPPVENTKGSWAENSPACADPSNAPTPPNRCLVLPTDIEAKSATFSSAAKLSLGRYDNTFTVKQPDFTETYFVKDGHFCLRYTSDPDYKKRQLARTAYDIQSNNANQTTLDILSMGKTLDQLKEIKKSREQLLGSCGGTCPEDKIANECKAAMGTYGSPQCASSPVGTADLIGVLGQLQTLQAHVDNKDEITSDFKNKGPLYQACLKVFGPPADKVDQSECSPNQTDKIYASLQRAIRGSGRGDGIADKFLNLRPNPSTSFEQISAAVKLNANATTEGGDVRNAKVSAAVDACLAPLKACLDDVAKLHEEPPTPAAKETCAVPLPAIVDGHRTDTIFSTDKATAGQAVGKITIKDGDISIQSQPKGSSLDVQFQGGQRVATSHDATGSPTGRLTMPLMCQPNGSRGIEFSPTIDIEGSDLGVDKKQCGGMTVTKQAFDPKAATAAASSSSPKTTN